MSPLQIRHTILRVLKGVEPHALPLDALHAEVNRLVRPAVSLAELKAHLSGLLDRSMVDFLNDPLDDKNPDARRWLVIEAGLAALKK